MKSINEGKYYKQGELIHVSSKDEIEYVIMK